MSVHSADTQVDITLNVDSVGLWIASPRDWGQGNTEGKQAEAAWMENLLLAVKETWPWATILHDGCPTGGSRIIEEFWHGTLGLPTKVFTPKWETCGPACPTDEAEHRKPRKPADKVHGTADTFCYDADVRVVKQVFHPESSVRPDKVLAVVTEYSRVTRAVTRLADEVGIPARRYAPKWYGNMFGTAPRIP